MYSFSLRDQARIKVYYGDGLAKAYEINKGKGEEAWFYSAYASPSFHRYVDRLRKSDREKFYKLQQHDTPANTYIPGIGYKVKHKYSDDIVYVIQGDEWGVSQKQVDRTRERAWIARRDASWLIWNKTNGGGVQGYLRSRQAYARECYVDRLTKKQKEAMMFIRMMDVGEFIEGVGGRGSNYGVEFVYILDC